MARAVTTCKELRSPSRFGTSRELRISCNLLTAEFIASHAAVPAHILQPLNRKIIAAAAKAKIMVETRLIP
jgi:hypothetical protein